MNSNENALQATIRKLNDCLKQDEESCWVADVFYRRDDAASPIIVRTEARDISISWDESNELGISMNEQDGCAGRQESSGASRRRPAGLRWVAGSQISRVALEGHLLGEGVRFDFESGVTLRVMQSGVETFVPHAA